MEVHAQQSLKPIIAQLILVVQMGVIEVFVSANNYKEFVGRGPQSLTVMDEYRRRL